MTETAAPLLAKLRLDGYAQDSPLIVLLTVGMESSKGLKIVMTEIQFLVTAVLQLAFLKLALLVLQNLQFAPLSVETDSLRPQKPVMTGTLRVQMDVAHNAGKKKDGPAKENPRFVLLHVGTELGQEKRNVIVLTGSLYKWLSFDFSKSLNCCS